ncbi:expansin-A9-like [Gastrolobium bilobum]|uniref:expansin-A9-like n=1 Tax=Gastrolobium bilobum TaxID=150636 RepID=UPI002AB19AAB|nr:expansin-A9-like [Gastrolobium bilobum]
MAFPLGAFLTSSLLFLIALPIPEVHANIVGGRNKALTPKHHRPKFRPGPWKQAHATFYEGGSGTFGGACGYEDVVKDGFGLDTAALSTVMFNQGQTCGACYEIKCTNSPQWCKPGQPSIIVTATNLCPSGGWCSPPREHFDLAKPSFLKIAEYKGGVVPVQYRRVPCKRQGGIRFTITGNPYFNLVKVWNVGGAGDIIGVKVKGSDKLKWTELKRNWGQKWETNAMLVGESLTFRVRASDGRYSTAWHVAPKNWQFGQTFEGKNFP